MAEKTFVTVVLRKEVTDQAAGKQIYDLVKERMFDYPEVQVSGNTNTQYVDEE